MYHARKRAKCWTKVGYLDLLAIKIEELPPQTLLVKSKANLNSKGSLNHRKGDSHRGDIHDFY